MPQSTRTALLIALSLACGGALGTQVAAQGLTPAQCDQVLMSGPQYASPDILAACSAYFTALAEGAIAPGAFGPVSTDVRVSTSGTSR